MNFNISLKNKNTFNFNIKASKYLEISDIANFQKRLIDGEFENQQIKILGGGSNIIFTQDYNGIIIHPTQSTITEIEKSNQSVTLKVAAGCDWDQFVHYTVNKNYHGLENLSLIPGQVGACPIQNIGAYGVEVKDHITKVEGFYLNNGQSFSLNNSECNFGYRDSIFKRTLKNKIFISHVYFKLALNSNYKLEYGHLKTEILNQHNTINLKTIRQTIIDIRNNKLPDHTKIGNAGSFFKNPIITEKQLLILKKQYPQIKYFKQENGIKIPAAWLIDTAGWKGHKTGDAGVHKNQALVLVNYGNASPQDIINLAQNIITDIKNKFDITLEMEVNIA